MTHSIVQLKVRCIEQEAQVVFEIICLYVNDTNTKKQVWF